VPGRDAGLSGADPVKIAPAIAIALIAWYVIWEGVKDHYREDGRWLDLV